MNIITDICPITGLKREINLVKTVDNLIDKTLQLDCDINYFNPITNTYIATNILTKDVTAITLSNINNLDGTGEYDYWKGLLNDMNGLKNKGINSFDDFTVYIVTKAYLNNLFNE
jgi:hypothetical protein